MAGFLAGALGIGKKVVTGVKSLISNAKAGKAALQAGFTIKGGTDTDAQRAQNSVLKSIPVYVWAIAGGFVLLVLVVLGFRKRR